MIFNVSCAQISPVAVAPLIFLLDVFWFQFLMMYFIVGLSLQDEVSVRPLPNQCRHTG